MAHNGSMAIQPPSVTKARARGVRRHARSVNSTTDTDHLRSLMHELLPPPPAGVAIYRSYGTEPRTHELMSMLIDEGRPVLCPRLSAPAPSGDVYIEWVEVTGDTTWQPGFRGIDEPTGPAATLAGVAVVIVPALAATSKGERLGQGGGHYDRALADIPRHHDGGPLLIGLVFEDEVCTQADWPVEAHDVHLDVVAGVRHL